MVNVVFDEQSAERIAKAVRWVEAQAVDESPDPQPLPSDEETPLTTCVALSKVEPSGNLTLLSDISASGEVVTGLSGTVVSGISGSVVTVLSGTVVTEVKCVDGNLVVTTEKLSNLSTTASLSNLSTTATLANLSTSANLSDVVTSNTLTVSLADFATVTTQNYTVPLQGDCE